MRMLACVLAAAVAATARASGSAALLPTDPTPGVVTSTQTDEDSVSNIRTVVQVQGTVSEYYSRTDELRRRFATPLNVTSNNLSNSVLVEMFQAVMDRQTVRSQQIIPEHVQLAFDVVAPNPLSEEIIVNAINNFLGPTSDSVSAALNVTASGRATVTTHAGQPEGHSLTPIAIPSPPPPSPPPPPPPFPPPPPTFFAVEWHLYAVIGGGAVVALLLLLVLYCLFCRGSKKPAEKSDAPEAKPSGDTPKK